MGITLLWVHGSRFEPERKIIENRICETCLLGLCSPPLSVLSVMRGNHVISVGSAPIGAYALVLLKIP